MTGRELSTPIHDALIAEIMQARIDALHRATASPRRVPTWFYAAGTVILLAALASLASLLVTR